MRSHQLILAAWLALAGVIAGCQEPPADEAANPGPDSVPAVSDNVGAATFADFSDRIDIYMKERAVAEASVPALKETSDPAQVSSREDALANALRTVRANATQGEIFTEAAAADFRRIVAADFQKRAASDRKALVEEVPTSGPPRINTGYSTELPLATFPPALLMSLPTLPDVLEYRFLGHHLILRDIKANLIVDYIPNVVPAPAPARS